MNWFSVKKLVFSEQIEFRQLIKTLREMVYIHISNTESFEDIETILSDVLTIHFFLKQKNKTLEREVSRYKQKIATTMIENLTSKQKKILSEIADLNGESYTLTALIGILSKKLEVAPSTMRWNLVALRDSGLINAGDKDNKGVPVKLTDIGKLTIRTGTQEQAMT